MQISSLFSSQQVSQTTFDEYTRKRNNTPIVTQSFDTVSISSEAMEAYRNSKISATQSFSSQFSTSQASPFNTSVSAPSAMGISGSGLFATDYRTPLEKEIESILTKWFNDMNTVTGPAALGGIIDGDTMIETVGTQNKLLPENEKLYAEIQAKIEKLSDNGKRNSAGVKQLTEQMDYYFGATGVINALGDKMVVTDEMLKKYAPFMNGLRDAADEAAGYTKATTMSDLQNMISGKSDTELTEEEKIRREKEKALEKMNQDSPKKVETDTAQTKADMTQSKEKATQSELQNLLTGTAVTVNSHKQKKQ